MTIRQQGGVFGRNPTFNDVDTNDLTVEGQLLQTGSENVGIGTASPSGSGTRKTVHIDGANGAAVRLSDAAGSSLLRYNTLGSLDLMTIGAVPLGLYTNNTERLNVASGGDVTVKTGNLVIGTSGNGIDFSATSGTGTSELFDDYEEGTFGVTLTDNGSSTISVSYNICNYVKIGRLVHFTGEVRISGITGTPGGDIKMNLPFFPASGSERSQRTRVFYNLSSLTGSPTGVGSGFIDNTDASMILQIENDFSIAAISSNIQVGTTFVFSATYQAAD